MKSFFTTFLFIYTFNVFTQSLSGTIVTKQIDATSLKHAKDDSPVRNVSIYLPPGYDQSISRYPVIYYLHGFTGKDNIYPLMKDILDRAIATQKIKPFILVQSDQYTTYQGSFYSNSSLTGNWTDFTAVDLVEYIDKNFRTIASKESRGIGGHSMGGYGAIKVAMLYPDVFNAMYALSPGLLALVKEFGPNSTSYKEFANIKSHEELNKTYYPKVLAAVGRAWSPNPNKPPFYCDMPYTYKGDSMIIDQKILDTWNQNLPTLMIDKYANNLKKLKAIKLDWGRNDASRFPIQIGMLSQKMENLGINHFAEEYIGDHGNKIWTIDGRVLNDFLPFFNDYLKF